MEENNEATPVIHLQVRKEVVPARMSRTIEVDLGGHTAEWEQEDLPDGKVRLSCLSLEEEFEPTGRFEIYRKCVVIRRHSFAMVKDQVPSTFTKLERESSCEVAKITQGYWSKSFATLPRPIGSIAALDGATMTPCLMVPVDSPDKDLKPLPIVF